MAVATNFQPFKHPAKIQFPIRLNYLSWFQNSNLQLNPVGVHNFSVLFIASIWHANSNSMSNWYYNKRHNTLINGILHTINLHFNWNNLSAQLNLTNLPEHLIYQANIPVRWDLCTSKNICRPANLSRRSAADARNHRGNIQTQYHIASWCWGIPSASPSPLLF